MSRYCGGRDPEPMLKAATHWRDVALLGHGSVFGSGELWTVENLEAIDQNFSRNPDAGKSSFLAKLEAQLAPCKAEVKQLAAEVMWFMFLAPSNVTPNKKREVIKAIWEWSGAPLPVSELLKDEALRGIGSGGPGFNNHRWRELSFFITSVLAFNAMPQAEQQRTASDGWGFAQWLQTVPDAENRQLRHMLLYLLFPDNFERIFSGGDRREIVAAFSGKGVAEISGKTAYELDKLLSEIRGSLEQEYRTKDLDFYQPPLDGWAEDIGEKLKIVGRSHVEAAIKRINEEGIPDDARSTTYDLLHLGNRYPPKLALSLAVEEATGAALDRTKFAGGEETSAFARLRALGFEIVLKKAISELVEGFLAQAAAATDLTVKKYPKEYRGLQIRVSFGQGVSARVPWIAFLAEGQKVSDGIYPVILYYRDAQVLILSYGMSEENGPAGSWNHLEDTTTIQEFLQSKYSKTPERYGNSIVDVGYEIPGKINVPELTYHLDKMIDLYRQALGDAPNATPNTSDEVSSEIQMSSTTNLILYGPPGTGKTYATAEWAVRLCDGILPEGGRAALMARYRELSERRRIDFITFHQSYSYEEFVEGLRPETEPEVNAEGGAKLGLRLAPRAGAFKAIADRAASDQGAKSAPIIDPTGREAFKMSLGRSADDSDDYLYKEAIENGYVLLGYGGNIDWSENVYSTFEGIKRKWRETHPDATGNDPNIQQIFALRSWMKEGDFVIISDGNKRFRAIGLIDGPYRFVSREHDTYYHQRQVKWLWVRPEGLPREEIYGRGFSQVSIYKLNSEFVKWPALAQIVSTGNNKSEDGLPQAYVLIIDEINRGNISKIFGELITLVEPDKRIGQEGALTVKLPYSGSEFGVPKNLHVIGTMNTADRSIALLDTALRRRFDFEELAPNPELISENVQGVNLRAAFKGLNSRIEYLYDRDHLIGHAYLQGCDTLEQLNKVMRQRVIPLLVEYFYEDWEKVRAVLKETKDNGAFIEREALSPGLENSADWLGGQERWRYTIKSVFTANNYEQLA